MLSNLHTHIARSKDNGETWEKYKVSTKPWHSSYQYYPTLTIDSNSVLHAVWSNQYKIVYSSSSDGGKTWGNDHNVSLGSSNYAPVIAVDGDDTVHIAWYGYHSGGSPYKIWYANRTSAGVLGFFLSVALAPSSVERRSAAPSAPTR